MSHNTNTITIMKQKRGIHLSKRVKEIVKTMKAARKALAPPFLPATPARAQQADLNVVSVSGYAGSVLRELRERIPKPADHVRRTRDYPQERGGRE